MTKDKKDYSILVIEDNPGDLTLIEDYLEEQILTPHITQVKNFAAAKLLLDQKEIYDVILLDLSLPDKSGEALITEINALCPVCPVIVLTGYTDIAFSIKSLSLGIADYLLKEDITATSLYKSILYNIERKKTNLELQESEKRYSNLFHLSPQSMWVYDPETLRFIQVNKAAVELYGYSEAEFLALTIMDIRPEEDRQKFKEILHKIIGKNNNIFTGRFTHTKRSGELMEVEIYSSPITLNDKIYRSVIAIDVTEKILFEHKITRAIIKTQEDERYEIGGELHDNVCQILAISQLSLGMLKKSVPAEAMPFHEQTLEYISMASKEIRNLSHRLAPAFFNDSTLADSFEMLQHAFNTENKYEISLFFDEAAKDYPLTQDIQLNLYRILQEQLRNIFNYANATHIEVDVILHNNDLKMRVFDNGVGFDMHAVKGGIGLANMKRRAELFSGKLIINSSPGNGCEIVVEIPLQEITAHEILETDRYKT
ncbi:MAG: PAS domain S-box protein [Ferruginibacter sp.]